MFKLGGYKPFNGEVNCEKFSSKKDKFIKMAAAQNDTHIIPEYTPVSNQGSIGSCAGNASADSLELLKGLEDPNKVEQVSRLFLYYNARALENNTNKDDGCYIHDVLHSMTTLGVCRESTWAYDINKVLVKPPIEAYREGNDNTITAFYQITSTGAQRLQDIETAVRANHGVVFGTIVGSEFQRYTGGSVLDIPKDNIGGHAMIITGVRTNSQGEKEFFVRNSWGSWGDNGHCWMTGRYLAWENTSDLFVPTRMIDFIV